METKKCAHCGRTVLAISNTCKHCGQSFESEETIQNETIETVPEQPHTDQSTDTGQHESVAQQQTPIAQPTEKRDNKKWWLSAIIGIIIVGLATYWVSREIEKEGNPPSNVGEEVMKDEEYPEAEDHIKSAAPQLSSEEEETKNGETGINVVLSAPKAIAKGEKVQLQYTLKGGEPSGDMQISDEIKGFDILFGPSVMQSYSSSNINGKVTSDSNITYTWVLMAKSEGTYILPRGSIKVDGNIYTSNTVRIEVLPPSEDKEKLTISKEDILSSNADAIDIRELQPHSKEGMESNKIYEKVEAMPSFPGGDNGLAQFISTNLKYPVVAQESGIQGRVTIRFVVSQTGAISDVTVVRGIDPSCDKEAIRVVKAMPKWNPGMQGGKPVSVYFTLPIVFRLTR